MSNLKERIQKVEALLEGSMSGVGSNVQVATWRDLEEWAYENGGKEVSLVLFWSRLPEDIKGEIVKEAVDTGWQEGYFDVFDIADVHDIIDPHVALRGLREEAAKLAETFARDVDFRTARARQIEPLVKRLGLFSYVEEYGERLTRRMNDVAKKVVSAVVSEQGDGWTGGVLSMWRAVYTALEEFLSKASVAFNISVSFEIASGIADSAGLDPRERDNLADTIDNVLSGRLSEVHNELGADFYGLKSDDFVKAVESYLQSKGKRMVADVQQVVEDLPSVLTVKDEWAQEIAVALAAELG